MNLSVLGPLEVTVSGRPIAVAGTLLRRLLVRLAVDAGTPVAQADLAAAIWPVDRPTDEANALQSLVSRLRRVFGDSGLVLQVPGGYRLAVDRSAVDLHLCATLAARGRAELNAGRPAAALATLTQARGLFRGVPLFDAGAVDYADQVVARVVELRSDVLADLFDAYLRLDRGPEVLPDLEELASTDLLRERFTGLLMSALAAAGRTAEALAAYERLRTHLADELGVDPSADLQGRHLALLRGTVAPPVVRSPVVRTNVRSFLTSFIGREVELERVTRLLTDHRLSTIVGPGGAGKTRLAAQAAAAQVGSSPDGVWMVELAPVIDEGGIPTAVLNALGSRSAKVLERVGERTALDSTERLLDLLERAECLLIMDNCEHLLGPVAELVDRILAHCPTVRVLTTSREPLGIVGEALCAIAALGLPPWGCGVAEAVTYPAVRLLMDRAAASTEFVVDADTVGPVVEIVRRLDGLPLAIELAAARLRVLPIAQIAARLSDRFRLLSGGNRAALPRHRTLRAVVEWSWDLLNPSERLLAERLAVFPAGATAESGSVVCSDELIPADEVPDLLLSLADKSLLQATGDAELRYRMLETIREYGVERLSERGELDRARAAHAHYFADLTERLEPALRTAGQLAALYRLGAERENILSALRYLADSGDPDRAIDLVLGLGWYWTLTGAHGEARTWTEFTLAATEGSDHPGRIFLEAVRALTSLAGGDDPSRSYPDVSWDHWREGLANLSLRLRRIPANPDRPLEVVLRPMMAFFSGDSVLGEELTAAVMNSADPWVRATVQVMRAGFAENRGDIDGMRTSVDLAYREFVQIGDRWGLAAVLGNRSVLRTLDGDLFGAIGDLDRALQYTTEIGAQDDDLVIHLRLSDLKMRIGDTDGAKRHLAAATAVAAGRPVSTERELLTQAALASIAEMEGNNDEAMRIVALLRERLASSGGSHAMHGHLAALIGSVAAVISIENDGIGLARADLVEGYREALGTQDLPVIAGTGVAIATLAEVTGHPAEAAVILGACARLRGGDDRTDPRILRVTARLRDQLGADFDEFYAKGCAMGQEEALAELNPAAF